jgi:cullin 2
MFLILRKCAKSRSKNKRLSSLYSDVYSICVAFPDPLADKLYAETKSFLENYVKSQLDEFNCYMNEMSDGENSSENLLLYKYYNAWKNYSKGLEYLNFLYQ